MVYLKVMNADNTVSAVEELEWPVFVKRVRSRLVRCEQVHGEGVVAKDGTTIYQIVGKPDIGAEGEHLGAVFIAQDEYNLLKQQFDTDDPEDPEDEAPEVPEGTEEEEILTRAELTAKVNELTEQNAMLMECMLEMSEAVYA